MQPSSPAQPLAAAVAGLSTHPDAELAAGTALTPPQGYELACPAFLTVMFDPAGRTAISSFLSLSSKPWNAVFPCRTRSSNPAT
jgi:hypothetical protein